MLALRFSMASLKLSPLSASRNFVQKRDFRTSLPRAALPPLLVMFLKPLSRLASVLIGRSTRIWWKKLDPAQKLVYKQKIVQYRAPILGSGVCLMGMSGLLYQSHLETCPITKRKKFVALKPNQMEKIAAVEFSNLLETYEDDLLPDKNPAYDRVARVCNRILRANADIPEVHGKDWTITVVDQDIRNAFVLPSGNIFVFTGMLQTCGNDDQLGVVMAHEISHTLLGHVSEKLSYVNFVNFLVLVPLALLWAVLPNDGISIVANWFFDKVIDVVLELPFSREMETEADEVGLQLAAKACIDIREAPAFWGKMKLLEAGTEADEIPEFISTHPAHESRQDNLKSLLPSMMKYRMDCGCSKLISPDPNAFIELYTKRYKYTRVAV